ncbi:MAG: SIR2 family protein, partial [Candidatus Omnitrophica bacterium]|nr:SIR2 family protein [Candidatus Omnitrophota bacterium]
NKTELDPLLGNNQNKEKILDALFDDINSYPYQYYLKQDIKTIDSLINAVGELSTDFTFIEQIRKVFLIDKDLSIPAEIKRIFIDNEPIAFFIGAGLSALDKQAPTWPALGNQAVDYLIEKEILTHHEADRLKSTVSDPKQKISILHNMLNFNSEDVKKFYESRFKKRNLKKESVYKILTGFREVLKLTSNIDNLICLAEEAYKKPKKVSWEESKDKDKQEPLDNSFNEKTDVVSEGFNKDMHPLEEKKIYFLHGYINNLKSIVMSTDQYAEAYYQPNKLERRDFLTEVFNKYTVIFMGYGLEELEILGNLSRETKQHYALMPTFFNESYLFRLEKSYLKNFNIEPIPYYLDFNKYARLKTVLEHWLNEIEKARTEEQIEGLQLIKEVISAKS